MRLVTRVIALSRAIQLRRQLREVNKALEQLPPALRRQLAAIAIREFNSASSSEFPHLYGTPPEDKYRAWGAGTEIGLERLQSENLQVRLRGIALWLTVAFHETKDSTYAEQQDLHKQVMRALRSLKESVPTDQLKQWMQEDTAAA
jgi:hypothetical protein